MQRYRGPYRVTGIWQLIHLRRRHIKMLMPWAGLALLLLAIPVGQSGRRGFNDDFIKPRLAQWNDQSQGSALKEKTFQALSPMAAAATAPIETISGRYSYGHCTYYVAQRRFVPAGWGHARTWFSRAQANGYQTGIEPRPGAIAWTPAGYFGHVALVEEVSGNQVLISEMNYAGWNRVSRRWVGQNEFKYIY